VRPMACGLVCDRGGASGGNDGWCMMAGIAQARLPSSERPTRGQMCALAKCMRRWCWLSQEVSDSR